MKQINIYIYIIEIKTSLRIKTWQHLIIRPHKHTKDKNYIVRK